MAGYVLLGKLSPADVGALADELRAAGGDRVGSLPELLFALGPDARRALDDPMDGVLTGPLQGALAGPGASLLDALSHLEGRPDPRDVLVYVEVFARSRRALLALALRLATELPPFPPDLLDGRVELFGWWRARAEPAAVPAGDGGEVVVPLPAGLGEAARGAAAAALGALFASLRRDAEKIGHPLRSFDGVAEAVADELLDGLAGLLLNGLGLDRAPRPGDVASRVGPAGCLPTRARHVRTVRIAGAPFQDALGRFFAVPSCPLESSQDGPHRGGEADREVPFSAGGLVGGRGRHGRLTAYSLIP
ncbi:MAG: hypothetical protein IPN03_11945 [Holophagales bacterium]|nr:hypothetical protein [Holophagales bacterium]